MKGFIIFSRVVFCLLILRAVPSPAGDQEPIFEKLNKSLKKDYLSVGALIQVVADYQYERSFVGNNGFSIANLRFLAFGKLDGGFGYFFQTKMENIIAILDAKMYYNLSKQLQIDAGVFKAPFSREFLTYAANIDFVNRSQIVTLLAPGRQIGFQLSGQSNNGSWRYAAGMFNGNKFDGNNNDNDKFMYAGRIEWMPKLTLSKTGNNQVAIAGNVAYSEDQQVFLGIYDPIAGFRGKRLLIGGDLRITSGRAMLASEIVYADLKTSKNEELKPFGFQATTGYMVHKKTQILFRWDNYSADDSGLSGEDSDLLIFGINFWPTMVSELQLNYIIQSQNSAFRHHQILINTQISF